MTITEFRAHAEALGRFASVREKAEPPADRILVQARDGALKLVAGTDARTIVVDAGPTEAKGMALVSARVLLNAAKTLRGKGEVTVEVSKDGAVIRTSTGGSMTLPNVGSELPGWLHPLDIGEGMDGLVVPAGFWPDASRLLTTVLSWAYGGWKQVELDVTPVGSYLRAADNYGMVNVDLDAGTFAPFTGAIDPDFIASIKDFEERGTMQWDPTLLTVTAGPYTAVTQFMRGWPKVPYLPAEYDFNRVKVTADRTSLINMVKGVANSDDEWKRVTLMTAGNDRFTVSAYGGGQAVTGPAQVEGEGKVSVVSERTLKLLAAVGGKTVTVQWGDSPVVCITGDKVPWSVFQSRLALG